MTISLTGLFFSLVSKMFNHVYARFYHTRLKLMEIPSAKPDLSQLSNPRVTGG